MQVTPQRILSIHPPPMVTADGEALVRSAGTHLTTITRYIAKQAGLLKVETQRFVGRDVIISDEEEDRWEEARKERRLGAINLRMALGMAWEEWAAKLYPEMIWQPGEFQLDDVAMTPDGVLPAKGGGIAQVEEFKLTYKSSLVKGSPRDIGMEWLWLAQVKSYCWRLETQLARVHVLYVNGGYRFGEDEVPEYWAYSLRFSEQELKTNWGLVMRHKKEAEREAKAEKAKGRGKKFKLVETERTERTARRNTR